MTKQQIIDALQGVGAIVSGHFELASGLHAEEFIHKDALFPYVALTSRFGRALAERFVDDGIEVVVAPPMGAVMLLPWVVHHLSEMTRREVLAVYAEKFEQPGSALWYVSLGLRMLWKQLPRLGRPPKQRFVIRRGYEKLLNARRVLVLEDVLTTGASAFAVVEEVGKHGGEVAGVGALWNRGGVEPSDLGNVPKLVPLVNRKFATFSPEECARIGPCSRGIAISTDKGRGAHR